MVMGREEATRLETLFESDSFGFFFSKNHLPLNSKVCLIELLQRRRKGFYRFGYALINGINNFERQKQSQVPP